MKILTHLAIVALFWSTTSIASEQCSQWEYKVVPKIKRTDAKEALYEELLNKHGAAGWELVLVYDEKTFAMYHFKRCIKLRN